MKQRPVLAMILLALAALFVFWFRHEAFALALFALPPLWLAAAAWLGRARAGFWAGVWALMWFSHGVMVAWTRPAERGQAWLEITLALLVVTVASHAGLRARFGRRKTQ
jgi:uncharacterized membrane protein